MNSLENKHELLMLQMGFTKLLIRYTNTGQNLLFNDH